MVRLPISAIIVNHNGGPLLQECVRSVLNDVEQVVVVDNLSSDTSMSELEVGFGHLTGVVCVRSPVNGGFAAGCNLGLSNASQPFFLFLNPDCILHTLSLSTMFSALSKGDGIGMVGGRLINSDGSEQGGGRRAVPTPWRSFVRAFGLNKLSGLWPKIFFDFYLHNQPLPNEPIEVEAISGALMLVSRHAMERVGVWDEQYFLHCEDLDLCMRFHDSGWKILFVPDAVVTHYQGGSSRARPIFVEWHKHKGMVRFYRKFFSHRYPGILMWCVHLGVWLRFCVVALGHGLRHFVQRVGG